jgi:sugar lactone lactonase YvrE
MRLRTRFALAGPVVLASACSGGGDLPTTPPTTITRITQGGFHAPTDAVASPDGKTFYFGGYTEASGATEDDGTGPQPAVFRVAAEPGATATAIASGDPLGAPLGLVLSCDGATVYLADPGSETASVFAIPAAGGAPSPLGAGEIARAGGLAMAPDCETLHVTGRTLDGAAAVFALPIGGGAARVVFSGAPLEAPTGIHVDDDGVSWVMDHGAIGPVGPGVLFAIPADGSAATVVTDDLRMGTPGGVSLTAGGGTAVMPTRDELGATQLTAVDIATGTVTQLTTPEIIAPAGLRTARDAGVFAVADAEGDAIYAAR